MAAFSFRTRSIFLWQSQWYYNSTVNCKSSSSHVSLRAKKVRKMMTVQNDIEMVVILGIYREENAASTNLYQWSRKPFFCTICRHSWIAILESCDIAGDGMKAEQKSYDLEVLCDHFYYMWTNHINLNTHIHVLKFEYHVCISWNSIICACICKITLYIYFIFHVL